MDKCNMGNNVRKEIVQLLLSISVLIILLSTMATIATITDQKVSARKSDVFSPTGGCVPGGSTCIPCDPGLAVHGANCIPSGDWHPSFSAGGGGSEGGTTHPSKIKPQVQSNNTSVSQK